MNSNFAAFSLQENNNEKINQSILRLAGAGFAFFLIAFLRIPNSDLQIPLPNWLLFLPFVSFYVNAVLATKTIENSLCRMRFYKTINTDFKSHY